METYRDNTEMEIKGTHSDSFSTSQNNHTISTEASESHCDSYGDDITPNTLEVGDSYEQAQSTSRLGDNQIQTLCSVFSLIKYRQLKFIHEFMYLHRTCLYLLFICNIFIMFVCDLCRVLTQYEVLYRKQIPPILLCGL